MSWQLWVLVAVAGIAVAALLVVRFRRAQKVFDSLVESMDPGPAEPRTPVVRPEAATGRVDELARRRSRAYSRATLFPRAAHGHRSRH